MLATEGVDDQALLCRVLKFMGFQSLHDDIQDLDPFWQPLLPLPKKGSFHAYKNLLYPYFFVSATSTYSVAVYQGNGDNLKQNLRDIFYANSSYTKELLAFGIVIDADQGLPAEASQKYADALQDFFPGISSVPGVVTPTSPRTGIYVWPDSQGMGTLETLLLECAAWVYPDHAQGALQFIDSLDGAHKAHWRGSAREKALIASIVSVLQPGKANHASLSTRTDKWVSEETVQNISGMDKLLAFVHALLGLYW